MASDVEIIKEYSLRGTAYYNEGNYGQAVKEFDKAIYKAIEFNLNAPSIAMIYVGRGIAYRGKGEFDLAIDDFNRAIKLSPNAVAYSDRGFAHSGKGEFDKAIDDFETAIQFDPNNVNMYKYRGFAYGKINDFDRAIADFKAAIQLDPNDAETRKWLKDAQEMLYEQRRENEERKHHEEQERQAKEKAEERERQAKEQENRRIKEKKKRLFLTIFSIALGLGIAIALFINSPDKNPEPIEANGMLAASRDGKTYKTVKIGKQTWMAENLSVKTGNSACYDNDESKCQECGRLYDWNAAMKACPSGWHLPSKEEWTALGNAAGGTGLKHVFSVLFCGLCYDGKFLHRGLLAQFWSATESDANYAWGVGFDARNANMDMGNLNKSLYLRSVRCVKD